MIRWGVFRVGIVSMAGVIIACQANRLPFAESDDSLKAIVSIPPQAYVVNRIGGDAVTVETMVPASAEPHTYEPRPDQLRAMSDADVYFRIRIDFEDAWMDRFAAVNPHMQIVDITQGIERVPLPTALGEPAAEPEAESNANGKDPHVWLSPRLVKRQAGAIAQTLSELEPDQASQFQSNLEEFIQDIDALDAEIRETLDGIENRKFLVFHPAWGYFAREYDLQMVAIEVGGQEPSAAELAEVIRFAQQQQIQVIFASPQFSQRAANTIAQEIDGRVLLIDPLAYDWLENLQTVAETFEDALRPSFHQNLILIGLKPTTDNFLQFVRTTSLRQLSSGFGFCNVDIISDIISEFWVAHHPCSGGSHGKG